MRALPYPLHNSNISTLHTLAEQSSLVLRSGSTRGVGEQESVVDKILEFARKTYCCNPSGNIGLWLETKAPRPTSNMSDTSSESVWLRETCCHKEKETHAREFDATVTTFRCTAFLLDVKVS